MQDYWFVVRCLWPALSCAEAEGWGLETQASQHLSHTLLLSKVYTDRNRQSRDSNAGNVSQDMGA